MRLFRRPKSAFTCRSIPVSPVTYSTTQALKMASKERIKRLANKLAVESEPGLTNAQLMLTNHDLKPVEPERRTWGPWNFVGFWVADSFNIVRSLYRTFKIVILIDPEYVDDFVFHDSQWLVMVAIMALCVDRIHHCSHLRLHHRKNWCDLSYFLSSRRESVIWHMGFPLASV